MLRRMGRYMWGSSVPEGGPVIFGAPSVVMAEAVKSAAAKAAKPKWYQFRKKRALKVAAHETAMKKQLLELVALTSKRNRLMDKSAKLPRSAKSDWSARDTRASEKRRQAHLDAQRQDRELSMRIKSLRAIAWQDPKVQQVQREINAKLDALVGQSRGDQKLKRITNDALSRFLGPDFRVTTVGYSGNVPKKGRGTPYFDLGIERRLPQKKESE